MQQTGGKAAEPKAEAEAARRRRRRRAAGRPPHRPAAGNAARAARRRAGVRVPAPRMPLGIADPSMLTDLLKWGGKRPGPARRSRATACGHAADEPVDRLESLPEVPGGALAAAERRCCSTSARSSAATSSSSASGSAASCSSRICSTDIDRHARAGTLDALAEALEPAIPPRRRHRRRHPVLGLLRLPRQGLGAGAGAANRPAAAPGRRGDGLFCTSRRRARHLHEVRDRRRDNVAAAPAPSRHRRRRARARRTATSSRCSRASRVRFVPAEEQHARDAAATQELSALAMRPAHRAAERLRHRATTMPGR